MWPRVAERVLGRWATTLRMAALLMCTIAVGLAGVFAVWGPLGLGAAVLLCALMHRAVRGVNRPLTD
jgi:hypothetical protein